MRLCELRADDDSRSRDELLYRQQVEADSVEMAHDREQAYFFGVWDKRMAEFEETAEEVGLGTPSSLLGSYRSS